MNRSTYISMFLALLSTEAIFADTFGSGGNKFTMDFVPITGGANADPNPDASNLIHYGAVPYDYRMGKYEVSRAMINAYNASSGGPTITLQDMTSFGGNGVNKPAFGVSWNEAARFVNWLNVSTGHSPAYKFTTNGANDNLALWNVGEPGYNASNRFRNAHARYFLPDENEWYRAAYYDPTAQVYWDFPTGTNIPNNPTSVASGTTPNTAVYDRTVTSGPADITQAGGLSPFGTMAQGGNAAEWMESAELTPNDSPAEDRAVRDGGYYSSSFSLTPNRQGEATTAAGFIGFRVASVMPTVEVTDINHNESTVTLDIESNFAMVDVYRSQDLILWGEPIAIGIAPGNDVIVDTAAPAGKAFYVVTPHGFPAPN